MKKFLTEHMPFSHLRKRLILPFDGLQENAVLASITPINVPPLHVRPTIRKNLMAALE